MNKELLTARFKSFVWRLGGMAAVALLAFLADNLGLFGLGTETQVVLGLVLGEVTKYLNTRQ